jgi:hypothetical protein
MAVGLKYLTAFTNGSPISGFKNVGKIAIDINPGLGDYSLGNFVGGVSGSYDSIGYVIISDTTTAGVVGRTTGGNTTGPAPADTPTFWVSATKDDAGFLSLFNRLPERADLASLTDPFEAAAWLRLSGYWTNYVTPLLSLDAVDYTSGNWVDSIGSKNFQLYNTPTLGTLNGSLSFDGSSQYLYTNSDVFVFGTADFTIEMWWYPTINHRSDVLDFWNNTGSRLIFGASITTGNLELYTDNPGIGSGAKITGPSTSTIINSWNHISLTRESGSIKMWLNGTQVGSTYNSNVLDYDNAMSLTIMSDHIAGPDGSGYLSNVRVVTGTAVYTSTFTPPTNSLENIPGTQLLLNTKQVPNFLQDSSMNNFTLGNEGSVNIVLDTPLDESYYFNFSATSSQYAECSTSLPDLSQWSIGVWHYYTGTNVGPGACILTELYPGNTSNINFSLGDNDNGGDLSSGFFNGAWNNSGQNGAYSLTPNNWYYIVGTYDGQTLNLYINNSSSVGYVSYIGFPISSQGGIRLMSRWDSNSYWGGKLAKVDIYDGALSTTQIDSIWNQNKSRFGL